METVAGGGTHFVLIHGACCGAWCWYKLVPLLRGANNTVTAVDLAAAGKQPEEVDDLNNLKNYVEPLMQVMADLPDDQKVVLVGHSLGGIATSLAMEKFPNKIHVAIFVTAYMPAPDFTQADIDEMFSLPQSYSLDTTYADDSYLFGPKYIAERMYTLSSPEDIVLAQSIARPYPSFELKRDCVLTKENYGTVRRVFIISGLDNGIKKKLQLEMIEKNPPEEVLEIPNSDHMVMCSQPVALFTHVLAVAKKYT